MWTTCTQRMPLQLGCPTALKRRVARLDAAVINEAVVHLEVGLLARALAVKAQEGVVERVAGLVVPDDVAGGDRAEAREDDLQVLRAIGSSQALCLCLVAQHGRSGHQHAGILSGGGGGGGGGERGTKRRGWGAACAAA